MAKICPIISASNAKLTLGKQYDNVIFLNEVMIFLSINHIASSNVLSDFQNESIRSIIVRAVTNKS